MKNKSVVKALVIGGSGSLGSEICRNIADSNFEVFFTYYKNKERAETLLQEVEPKCKTSHCHLDLNDLNSIKETVFRANEFLGGIDALIIASGLATGHDVKGQPHVPDFIDMTPEGFDEMISVNVRGIFFVCRETAQIMRQQKSGKIVIIGSIDGVKPVPAPADYACCKAALWGLTQALSKELGKFNILVNMVAPGILEGGIAELLSEELMKEYIKHCSLRRVGSFSEVAKMAAFLSGEKNTYLTGQALILDGGL